MHSGRTPLSVSWTEQCLREAAEGLRAQAGGGAGDAADALTRLLASVDGGQALSGEEIHSLVGELLGMFRGSGCWG